MLNEVKHLKACKTFKCRTAREILHYVQNDIVSVFATSLMSLLSLSSLLSLKKISPQKSLSDTLSRLFCLFVRSFL